MLFYFIPFLFQGAAMIFDEFYFHRQRGLPLWERIGHPLDTLTVLACYLFLVFCPVSITNINIYIGLCAFSCLFITKDEFIHTEKCDAKENWLHSVLFILHPITFMSAGFIWAWGLSPTFLLVQPFVIAAFLLYQIIYWSFIGKSK